MKKLLIAAAVSAVMSAPAFATNGTAPVGIGQSAKGSGGAGAAYAQDTLAAGTNPAGMVHIGDRVDFGLEIFSPDRRFSSPDIQTFVPDGNGGFQPGPTISGGTFSGNNPKNFYIPEFGYNKMIDDRTSVGISVFGAGGQNATYTNHPVALYFSGFQSGAVKTDLSQVFVMPTVAYKVNDKHSIGVSPILAVQAFEFYNLGYASPVPAGRGHDTSWGLGVRVGWMGQMTDRLTLGASIQSKINMSTMDDYSDVLVSDTIDVPMNFTAGLAYAVNDKLDILADVYYIDYKDVKAIGTSTNEGGFGWDSIWVLKLGVVYDYSDTLILRGGINYGESPLPSGNYADGYASTLVPATTKTHLTFGLTKELQEGFSLTGSFIYTLNEDHTADAILPPPAGFPPLPALTAEMDQWALGVSANWTF